MLNPFPSLLVYSFFVPTLLRTTVAVAFFYIAYYLGREEKKFVGVKIPIVGTMRSWMVWVSVIVSALVALCLLIGFETQWAALVGILIMSKHLWATRSYAKYLPFTCITYTLLLIICLSLLFSGAGAFAFDLPL